MSFRPAKTKNVLDLHSFVVFLLHFSKLGYTQQHLLTSKIFPNARKYDLGFVALFSCLNTFS